MISAFAFPYWTKSQRARSYASLQEPQGVARLSLLTMRGFVAVNAQCMELVENDLRRDRRKRLVPKQIDECRLIWLRQAAGRGRYPSSGSRRTDAASPARSPDRHAHKPRQSRQVGEFRPPTAKDFKVLRLHAIASARAVSNALRFATITGISCWSSRACATSAATSSESNTEVPCAPEP